MAVLCLLKELQAGHHEDGGLAEVPVGLMPHLVRRK